MSGHRVVLNSVGQATDTELRVSCLRQEGSSDSGVLGMSQSVSQSATHPYGATDDPLSVPRMVRACAEHSNLAFTTTRERRVSDVLLRGAACVDCR